MVISDFYTEPNDLAPVLLGLAARGHDLLLVHILDPEERNVGLKNAATLRDAETGEVMEVSPEELAANYSERLHNHIDDAFLATPIANSWCCWTAAPPWIRQNSQPGVR